MAQKIATTEDVLIGIVSSLALGIIIGYMIGIKIEYFANPKLRECIQQNKYI